MGCPGNITPKQDPSTRVRKIQPKGLAWLPLQKLVGEFCFDFGEGNFAGNLPGILWDFFGPIK